MKAKSAFTDPNTGRLVMPGEAVDEKAMEPEEVERLKNAGYLADGSGFKAGEGKLEDMSLTDLKATGRAKGLDVENIRTKDRLIAAINAASVEPYRAPTEAPKEQGVVTIKKGMGTNVIESKPIEPDTAPAGAPQRAPATKTAQAAERTRGGTQRA